MKLLQNAFWSGIMATGPMTISLFNLYRELPSDEKSPLPPATLTNDVLKTVNLDKALSSNRQADVTMVSHFGYGIAAALVYALAQRHVKASPAVKGAAFGLGVWTLSYFGWVPAFGFRSNAYNMTPKRNAMMALAHVVWGASLGTTEERLRKQGNAMLDGRRKAIAAE